MAAATQWLALYWHIDRRASGPAAWQVLSPFPGPALLLSFGCHRSLMRNKFRANVELAIPVPKTPAVNLSLTDTAQFEIN